jgi:hypothetical protein
MITSHIDFDENWELTLEYFQVPQCDMWPQKGTRPEWWPVKWAGAWPYDRSTQEQYAALVAKDPLTVLTQNLTLQATSRMTWLCLGPKGDVHLLGRPSNHLSQMAEWVLAPDTGMRKATQVLVPLEDANHMKSDGKAKRKGMRPAQEQASKRRLPQRIQ